MRQVVVKRLKIRSRAYTFQMGGGVYGTVGFHSRHKSVIKGTTKRGWAQCFCILPLGLVISLIYLKA